MNNNKGGSFKPKKVYFSQVSNHALRDKELTLQAKGLYSLIQSYITIENFVLYKDMLIRQSNVGKHAFNTSWKELKDKGYLLQERHSDGGGKFYYVYELVDKPLKNTEVSPCTDFPCMDEPCTDNWGDSNNTNSNNTDLNNTHKTHLHHSENDDNLHFLKDIENDYIDSYLSIMNLYGYKHKRVNDRNLDYITSGIEVLIDYDIDINMWSESVHEHFRKLPKNNDGDIVAFLIASKRYFDVDLKDSIDR